MRRLGSSPTSSAMANSVAADHSPDECQATAILADWFAGLLLAPPQARDIARLQTADARLFLQTLADALDCATTADALIDLIHSAPADALEIRLSRDYVQMFEGVAGPKSISLYESSYCGQGSSLFNQPFVDMLDILNALDLRIDGPCREPADHLAVELAALAKALRLGRLDVADRLVARLRAWTPPVAAAVGRSAHGGFYRHLFALLDAFLSTAASPQWLLGGQAPLSHEAHHVHG